MKGVKIEIVKSAEDGEAIIRLLGVFELPEKPVFRIDPLDDDARRGEQEGWPSGEITASRMRVGEAGVEMSVLADAIEWPALLPGTPVALSVPSASIREELRWPSLAALHSARRGVVVVSAEKRRAEIAARAKARRAELENMAAVRLAEEASVEFVNSESTPAVAVGEELSRLDVKRKGTVKLVASSEVLKKDFVSDEPPSVASPPTPPHQPEQAQSPATVPVSDEATPPVSAPTHLPLLPPANRVASTDAPTALNPPLPNFHPARSKPTASAPLPHDIAKQRPQMTPPPLPARSPTAPAHAATPVHQLSGQTPKFLTRHEEKARSPYVFQRAFGLGFVVAALLAFASMYALREGSNIAGMLPSSTSHSTQSTVSQASEQPSTLTTLSAILSVPDVSTSGEQATAIDLADALKKADQSLAGLSRADKEEAKYWLRRSLAQGLGEQRLVWALTQLGTLYAAPITGAPDYVSARTLWELAAAQGDPIALCFLASLYEHGLGVARDEVRALVLYRNAKTQGGCRNIDQSIARLTKGEP